MPIDHYDIVIIGGGPVGKITKKSICTNQPGNSMCLVNENIRIRSRKV